MAKGSAARRERAEVEFDSIEQDFLILETIGRYYDAASGALSERQMEEALSSWFAGREPPDSSETMIVRTLEMAIHLALFTPSLSGATPLGRFLRSAKPATPEENVAIAALNGAKVRLLEIVGRDTIDLVRCKDRLSGEDLILLDSRISPLAAGLNVVLRLCTLPSGRQVVISPLFALDPAMLERVMSFVKPGKGLGNGYRCVVALYREAARHGAIEVPELTSGFDDLPDPEDLPEANRLALEWLLVQDDAAGTEAWVSQVRRLTSVETLIDALGSYGDCGPDAPEGVQAAFVRIAEIQMETVIRRGAAGRVDARAFLDQVVAEVDGHVGRGAMKSGARRLFDQLKARLAIPQARKAEAAVGSELERTLQRIQALRAKTVDQGCTEEEALAAAVKVAELLDRYGLTLDDVSIREEVCEAIGVSTDRRRASAIDSCVQAIAGFCDCKAWGEKSASGTVGVMFFGLKADVQAARFLYELIAVTFESETTAFRGRDLYLELSGGERRRATNSFQLGLAKGIVGKLDALKAKRDAAMTKTSGRDLVPLKASMVEEELDKLGISFVSKDASRRRSVDGAAYHAGTIAGTAFEPFRGIDEAE